MSLTTQPGHQSELMLELIDDRDLRRVLHQTLVITRAMLSEPDARPHVAWLRQLAAACRPADAGLGS